MRAPLPQAADAARRWAERFRERYRRWRAGAWYYAGRAAGALRIVRYRPAPPANPPAAPGISVVIPSRNGRELLEAQLPAIVRDLSAFASEVLIVDNGSDDGTAQWLQAAWPAAIVEVSAAPLSFSRAVNRGIAGARFSHICLLNNDMRIQPGFFAALLSALRAADGNILRHGSDPFSGGCPA